MSYEMQGVKQISNDELKEVLKTVSNEAMVIDVREPEEFNAGHIPDIHLLPMQEIPEMIEGFDPEKEYIFICRSGNRSQNVAMYLKQHGLSNITNVEGGMMFWDGDVNRGIENRIQSVETLKQAVNQQL
ncbi:rhodanese-like domain-containing protein [Salisediminibacterium beveridgei]|uniref:Rhodanese domain-containing protein n=1 Tax=Salisediminibacterium beveridgei TaxID=632773 RepID=A0A1D7QWM4_9BACI|nr:rhodanese-like domain-containing protein [Salisediminibacterium beveridgei]AOM83406.1 hypothetical protein BBEV_2046 [Salisediminibacterium beveridgei]AOM83420.1 hypothetical protein BBEV_2062 [Salisediminibacterium beveridgei]